MRRSLRKHLASVWPRQEQKSHLERPVAVGVELGVEEVFGEVEGALEGDLEGLDDAENAEEVSERLEQVWSMFLRD